MPGSDRYLNNSRIGEPAGFWNEEVNAYMSS